MSNEGAVKRVSFWTAITGGAGIKNDFKRLAECQADKNFLEGTQEIKTFLPDLKTKLGPMYAIARLIYFRNLK